MKTQDTSTNLVGTVAFAVQDPALITVDLSAVEKRTQEHVKQLTVPQKSDPQREYDRLVQKHFDLKQWLRSSENRLNEAVGQIHLIKDRLATKIKERDANESPLGRRHCERAIENLEFELDDAEHKLKKYVRSENKQAVAALKAFEAQELPRLEELRKVVNKK